MSGEAKRDFGAPPELAWIPVGRLAVDRSYQRTIEGKRSQDLIQRIAADFRWAAFQAILVTRGRPDAGEGGGEPGYLIIDGQHRVEAAKRAGIDTVPAVVVIAASIEDQAAAFVRANTDRVSVNQFSLHRARLAAGDPAAVAIARLCEGAGIAIPAYQPRAEDLKPGQTLALGTIARLPGRFGEDIAALTVGLLGRAYGRHVGALRAPVFMAVAMLLKDVAASDRAEWARKVEAYLATGDHKKLAIRAIERRARAGGTEAAATLSLIQDGIGRGPRVASAPAPRPAPAPAAPAPKPAASAPAVAKPAIRRPLPSGKRLAKAEHPHETAEEFLARGGRVTRIETPKLADAGGVPARPKGYAG